LTKPATREIKRLQVLEMNGKHMSLRKKEDLEFLDSMSDENLSKSKLIHKYRKESFSTNVQIPMQSYREHKESITHYAIKRTKLISSNSLKRSGDPQST
jgi:hypothetical protein